MAEQLTTEEIQAGVQATVDRLCDPNAEVTLMELRWQVAKIIKAVIDQSYLAQGSIATLARESLDLRAEMRRSANAPARQGAGSIVINVPPNPGSTKVIERNAAGEISRIIEQPNKPR